MPLTKTEKEQLIEDYEQGLAAAPHAFLLDYKGISVPQVTALREKVRQSGGHYAVVKNTLALRAIDGKALAALKEHFVGPTAVVYSETDALPVSEERKPAFSGFTYSIWGVCIMILASPALLVLGLIQKFRGPPRE